MNEAYAYWCWYWLQPTNERYQRAMSACIKLDLPYDDMVSARDKAFERAKRWDVKLEAKEPAT